MEDTIAAIATAPGRGGISIVRISGPEAEKVLMQVFRPAGKQREPVSHMLTYGHCIDGARIIDECMAVLMRAPKSYTREDVAEIQLHGGAYTPQAVLECCLSHGARLAEPGEFTRRAFLNGRIDLSQAEAVMEVIAANGRQAHEAAERQLAGGTSSFIRQAADELYRLQAGAAACIDYPEEISEEEATADLAPKARMLAERLRQACNDRAVRLLHEGMKVALCGRPNVGKSSLLNALLGEERAIVTDIPGTTRDTVQGEMTLGGISVQLTDTAGLRETEDTVEQIGVRRARRAIDGSDCVLLVMDAHSPMTEEDRSLLMTIHGGHMAVLLNKSDLSPALSEQDITAIRPDISVLKTSAVDAASLKPLLELMTGLAKVDERLVLTQPRHLQAAREAAEHLLRAADAMETATVDLASIDLEAAQRALARITGDCVQEKLLDEVFSRFCVGK